MREKGAFRIKRDFGRESTVGATLTTIDEDDDATFSRLVSADTRMRLSDQTVLTAQIAGSFADDAVSRRRCSAGRVNVTGSGLGYYAKIERRGRHALTALTASGSSADYRADLGFTRRANTNGRHAADHLQLRAAARRATDFVERDERRRRAVGLAGPRGLRLRLSAAAAELQAADVAAAVCVSRLRALVRGRVRRAARPGSRGRVHRRQRTFDELGRVHRAGRARRRARRWP